MPKVLLNNLSSLANETSAIALINANNDAIEEGFNNTISRNGLSPNTWEADLDINNNHIINLAEPTDNSHAATKYYVDNNPGPTGATGPTGPQGETGATGPQGDQGDAVIWIAQAGAPSDLNDGEDGDMYLDSTTGAVYGPKASGAWGTSIADLTGPQGPAGSGDLSGPGMAVTDGNLVSWNGTGGSEVEDSGIAAANVLVDADIGTTVQAYDAQLDTWSGVTPSANGQSLVSAANYAAMRALLDLEPNTDFYAPGGTDVPVIDGGTGSSTASGARTNLGLVIGTDVAAATVGQGIHTIWIPATAMISRTTNGAASVTTELASNFVMLSTKDFDQTTSEGVQFHVAMPKSWDEGTVTFIPYWTAAAGTATQTVIWTMAGLARSNDDALDTAFGTAQSSSDALIATNDLHIGPESSAITIGGTPAENDMVIFRITRDISDTLAADAKLIGVKVLITTNAATDA